MPHNSHVTMVTIFANDFFSLHLICLATSVSRPQHARPLHGQHVTSQSPHSYDTLSPLSTKPRHVIPLVNQSTTRCPSGPPNHDTSFLWSTNPRHVVPLVSRTTTHRPFGRLHTSESAGAGVGGGGGGEPDFLSGWPIERIVPGKRRGQPDEGQKRRGVGVRPLDGHRAATPPPPPPRAARASIATVCRRARSPSGDDGWSRQLGWRLTPAAGGPATSERDRWCRAGTARNSQKMIAEFIISCPIARWFLPLYSPLTGTI